MEDLKRKVGWAFRFPAKYGVSVLRCEDFWSEILGS
jgi:hypothetical protein